MKCTKCGMELADDMKFCIGCGAPIQKEDAEQSNEKVCVVCGSPLIKGYRFCTVCGVKVPDDNVDLPLSETIAENTAEDSVSVTRTAQQSEDDESVMATTPETCPACGSRWVRGYRFCTFCGISLEELGGNQLDKSADNSSEIASTPNADVSVTDAEAPLSGGEEENPDNTEYESEEVPPKMEPGKDGWHSGENAENANCDVPSLLADEIMMSSGAQVSENANEAEVERRGGILPNSVGNNNDIEGDEEDTEETLDDETITSEIRILVLIRQDGTQERYEAPIYEEIGIGRKRGDIIIADDPELSRKHCRILLKKDGMYAADMSSKNGTFLNRKRLESDAEVLIQIGDILRMGRHSYKVDLRME